MLRERIRPELDGYLGGCFERLCRETLPVLHAREGVTGAFEVGEYWDRSTQIDVVALRDDGWTDLGECRWGRVRSRHAVAGELEAKVPLFPNARNATIGLRIFTRDAPPRPERAAAGRGSGAREVRWHTLADLYA